ncbi:hypothetical protein JOB18_001934 [Solea senegalensis]|uniref:Uncharacterized protein n=1 Tax=Solea senegalensis TaxID=28829 RepID=A0AAV6QFP5_SOLSE|nr:hypothetical protein JOB18_001934 [Solea senegalensis]
MEAARRQTRRVMWQLLKALAPVIREGGKKPAEDQSATLSSRSKWFDVSTSHTNWSSVSSTSQPQGMRHDHGRRKRKKKKKESVHFS